MFVNLLKSPRCVEAVRSKYLEDDKKKKLVALLKSCQGLQESSGVGVSKADQALFDSAVSLYSAE